MTRRVYNALRKQADWKTKTAAGFGVGIPAALVAKLLGMPTWGALATGGALGAGAAVGVDPLINYIKKKKAEKDLQEWRTKALNMGASGQVVDAIMQRAKRTGTKPEAKYLYFKPEEQAKLVDEEDQYYDADPEPDPILSQLPKTKFNEILAGLGIK